MAQSKRIEWIDCARGLCIILVVMMYAADWVAQVAGEGWLHAVVEFARPFRMPDFFLVSGLLLGRTIRREWSLYLDRKVLHFAYFYVLWLSIAFVLLGPFRAGREGVEATLAAYLHAFVRPYGWLWFIYLLPVFFVVTKLLLPARPWLVWLAAALLNVAQLHTDFKVLDKFAQYYVFFYTGYAFAPWVFRLADAARANPGRAVALLATWAALDAWMVHTGHAASPLATVALGLAGAAAVVAFAALVADSRTGALLRYCGHNSIVIYLAFFIPGLGARVALSRAGIAPDPGTFALLVMLAGVLGALALFWMVRGTRFSFLFERPHWARLGVRRTALQS